MAHVKFYIGCVLLVIASAILIFSGIQENDWHVIASMSTAIVFLLLDKIDSVKDSHE